MTNLILFALLCAYAPGAAFTLFSLVAIVVIIAACTDADA